MNTSRIHCTCTYLGEIAKLNVNEDVADDNSKHERARHHDCSNAREFQSRIALRGLITLSAALEVHPAVLQRLAAHRYSLWIEQSPCKLTSTFTAQCSHSLGNLHKVLIELS